jgi:hypothetical protein
MIPPKEGTMRTRSLLAIGVVAPPLFVAALLIEGFTRSGYSSWRDMGSVLSVGPGGWQQIVNFIVCGLLVMVSAAGLARSYPVTVWGPRLVALFGLSLVIAGAFATDPANGYPPGSPPAGGPQTWHGTIHGANAILAFGSISLAAVVFGRALGRDPRTRLWASYSYLTAIVGAVLFVASLTVAVLDQKHVWHNAPGGLLERLTIIIAWTWLSLLSLRALRPHLDSVLTSPSEA